eukprot:TRINITY_DN33788_c0_g1_i1.p1 TRINITY_DN33788_c0_g1~~TRINITY_DN33788_c0_g1_i1.p1  ORF type:complete len:454 (+),score=113.33 TRINITY_DN33788_c0_g1_i1:334-1695(+)
MPTIQVLGRGRGRPGKDWVLKTDQGFDGESLSYLDSMERSDSEERKRLRERQLMDEGRAIWEQKKQEEQDLLFRDVEEIKDLARAKMFGKPGHGAPTGDIRKKKFTEHQINKGMTRSQSTFSLDDAGDFIGIPAAPLARFSSETELQAGDALAFGRSGAGAPMRTKSGRLRSTVYGNPEIRFQNNESVQKSISNHIRYAADKEDKYQYHSELENQIRQRQQVAEMEKENDLSISRQMEEVEGTQWGKPGPGGAYWRNSALTGQGFFDKMGWNSSTDPRKRDIQIRRGEAENIKREMSEAEVRRNMEHKDMNSDVGLELAPLMMNQTTGNPKRDPSTGYMMNHSLSTTDVTKLASLQGPQPWHSTDNKQQYWEQLTGQVSEKQNIGARGRQIDEQQQKQHFESWETFWGRPGNGAPIRDSSQKENLMKMLHYPENSNKAPNNVELITLERLSVK